jgi:hypothetical protein
MAHELAIVSSIQKIEPIEGKDRIELATVQNYKSVVQKGEFHVGDTVIYVFYDAILPQREEFEFLRKRCWSPKYQGFRIRPMKLGSVISEGLVLPMSMLPSNKKFKFGDVVTDELGITLYDPEYNPTKPKAEPKGLFKTLMRLPVFRKIYGSWVNFKKAHSDKNYPDWVVKSDEDNIEKLWDSLHDCDRFFIITEKVEGMSTSFAIEKGKFKVYSHNWKVKEGAWVDYAVKHNIEAKLRAYCKNHNLKSICIQGELVGPNIQKNIYNLKDFDFYMFGGYYSNKKKFTYTEVVDVANEIKEKSVPFVRFDYVTDFTDVDAIVKDADGISSIYNVKREGLVWRTEEGDIHFKSKSRDYKAWLEKKIEKDGE